MPTAFLHLDHRVSDSPRHRHVDPPDAGRPRERSSLSPPTSRLLRTPSHRLPPRPRRTDAGRLGDDAGASRVRDVSFRTVSAGTVSATLQPRPKGVGQFWDGTGHRNGYVDRSSPSDAGVSGTISDVVRRDCRALLMGRYASGRRSRRPGLASVVTGGRATEFRDDRPRAQPSPELSVIAPVCVVGGVAGLGASIHRWALAGC